MDAGASDIFLRATNIGETSEFEIVYSSTETAVDIGFNITSSGTIANFTSEYLSSEAASTYVIDVLENELATGSEEYVLGTFSVSSSGSDLPNILLSSLTIDGVSVADIVVDIENVQIDGNGDYQFEVENGHTVMIDGFNSYSFDFNNPSVRSIDALKTLDIALERTDYTMEELIAADITQDGSIRSLDALQVLKNALNEDMSLTGNWAEWVFIDNDFLAEANATLSNPDTPSDQKIYAENADWDQVTIIENITTDTALDMTTILVGDVDGSYSV